ncbi:MAG: hypothetical protein ACTHMI_10315 [Mucilaginibacter sp.]|uniref:hypothetical protein n=1 Tax=Mucilaginibacter sp. L3T2-6 TaxID=3062491 RepID=UPI00267592FF|nr:hypothetical protein [Mucilaginibacter sp. L3T2-6]MDO3642316.1 hypothetical protein [Mucilaginibacter sp. L3T2-6]MDV6214811.1 hypothetical protein [Mucilaginibacter sp. L3T2-6]
MKDTAKTEKKQAAGASRRSLRALKHDVKNQLSNILLAIEQLRYEIPEMTEDCVFYLDSISLSSAKIDTLLKEVDQVE